MNESVAQAATRKQESANKKTRRRLKDTKVQPQKTRYREVAVIKCPKDVVTAALVHV